MTTSPPREVIIVDVGVADWKTLTASLSPEIPVILLPEGGNGLEALAAALANYGMLDALHLVSHGSSGRLILGDLQLTRDKIDANANALTNIATHLSGDSDLLLYGCSVATGEVGEAFVAELSASLNGADIAASTDRTGPLSLNGDWDLEYILGDVETVLPFTVQGMQEFDHCLGCTSSTSFFPTCLTVPGSNAPVITSNGAGITATISYAENGTTAVTTVTANDLDIGDSKNFSLSGGTDQTLFSIHSLTGALTFKASPNFEGSGDNSYQVTVRITDRTGLYDEQTLTINVTNVNEAPTDLALSASTLTENIDTTGGIKVGTLTVTDPDASGNANVLSLEGTDAASFELRNGNELYYVGTSPDFELKSSYGLTVKATDGSLVYSKTFSVNVTNVNEAPTDLALSASTLTENVDTTGGIKIGTLTITDPDASGNANVLSLEGTDAASFELRNGNELYYVGTSPDFELKPSYNLTARTTDGALTYSRSLTITVIDINESAPSPAPQSPPQDKIPPRDSWTDLPDNDGDGIPEQVENLVPSLGGVAGDGNGDGIPDIQQSEVASVPFRNTQQVSQDPDAPVVFVTLVGGSENGVPRSESSVKITSAQQLDAPADKPADLAMPLGLIGFTAVAASSGSTETFSLLIDGDIAINGYWKQNTQGTWVNLASAEYGGRVVTENGKTRLDFTITDGGQFDDDGKADGIISDPGAPGWFGSADRDKDQFPDTLELQNGLNVGTKDNDVFTSSKFFVMQLYRDIHGREADQEGLLYWQQKIDSGTLDRAQVASAVLDSAEFQAGTGAIARLYFGALDRLPDNDGLHFWRSQLQENGTLSQVAESFATSTEFAIRYGSQDNTGFVDQLYLNTLGRTADSNGKAYWLGQLAGGLSKGNALLSFTESAEYRQATDAKVTLTLNYVGLLGRSPEQQGFDYWLQMMNGSHNEAQVIRSFLATTEYHDRFLPAGEIVLLGNIPDSTLL